MRSLYVTFAIHFRNIYGRGTEFNQLERCDFVDLHFNTHFKLLEGVKTFYELNP